MAAMPARLALVLLLAAAAGCTNVRPGTNAKAPTLARPVVVIGGIAEPGFAATYVGRWVKEHAGDHRVVAVSPGFSVTFDGAAEVVVDAVQRYFPSDDPTRTVPVDVIGVSMGGDVARHAAAPPPPGGGFGRRLDVRNLYGIASPFSGAAAADFFGPLGFGTARAMRTNSPFLRRLALREQRPDATPYPVVNYARGHDRTVGKGVALPPHLRERGEVIRIDVPWYVLNGHSLAFRDPRILADLLRRLEAQEGASPSTRPAATSVARSRPAGRRRLFRK